MRYLKRFDNHSEYESVKDELEKNFVAICDEEEDVHFYVDSNSLPNINYEYVDLGLPSGTLWATCNLGASTETEYGLYFAWGETEPKEENEEYSWAYYKYGTDEHNITKYCTSTNNGTNPDNKTELDLEDDAAHIITHGDSHIATKVLFEELNTLPSEWVTNYNNSGVNGRVFTGSNGNTLFIPAAGSILWDEEVCVGDYCYLWTSSVRTDYSAEAIFFEASNNSAEFETNNRCFGYPVRAVLNNDES